MVRVACAAVSCLETLDAKRILSHSVSPRPGGDGDGEERAAGSAGEGGGGGGGGGKVTMLVDFLARARQRWCNLPSAIRTG